MTSKEEMQCNLVERTCCLALDEIVNPDSTTNYLTSTTWLLRAYFFICQGKIIMLWRLQVTLWRSDGIWAVFSTSASIWMYSAASGQSLCMLCMHASAPSFCDRFSPSDSRESRPLLLGPGDRKQGEAAKGRSQASLTCDPSQPGCAWGWGWGKASVWCHSTFLV